MLYNKTIKTEEPTMDYENALNESLNEVENGSMTETSWEDFIDFCESTSRIEEEA